MKYLLMALLTALVLTGCQTADKGTYNDGPNDRHSVKANSNLRQPGVPLPR